MEGRTARLEAVKANILAAQERQKKLYDRKHSDPDVFVVGSKEGLARRVPVESRTTNGLVPPNFCALGRVLHRLGVRNPCKVISRVNGVHLKGTTSPPPKIPTPRIDLQRIPTLKITPLTTPRIALQRIPTLKITPLTTRRIALQRISTLKITPLTTRRIALQRISTLKITPLRVPILRIALQRIPTLKITPLTTPRIALQRIPTLKITPLTTRRIALQRIPHPRSPHPLPRIPTPKIARHRIPPARGTMHFLKKG